MKAPNQSGRRGSIARPKDSYMVRVHYPETEEGMLEIKRRMGAAYIQFVKEYILSLPISDEGKNKLFEETSEHLKKYSGVVHL